MIGDNPVFGYRVQGPAFDVAFQRALRTYPLLANTTRLTIHRPGMISCPDAAAVLPLEAAQAELQWFRKLDGFTVIVTAGKSI